MKATTIIIAAVLALQVTVLFAGNREARPIVSRETTSMTLNILAPVTPVVAIFEDAVESNNTSSDISALAPATPEEADFNDSTAVQAIDLNGLTPVTPKEAEFE